MKLLMRQFLKNVVMSVCEIRERSEFAALDKKVLVFIRTNHQIRNQF